jgi:DNA-binding PadR family transcriptional regulator
MAPGQRLPAAFRNRHLHHDREATPFGQRFEPCRCGKGMSAAEPQRELFVLGLLRRRPASAYALDKAMRDHSPLYRSFRRGNLYSFVERLAASGLLEFEDAAARRGPHRSKTVYRLSAAGERRFAELLTAVMLDVQAEHAALETALVLLGQLSRERAAGLLTQRAEHVAAHERRLSRLRGDIKDRAGAAYLSASYALHRLRAERRYLGDALALLHDARWEPSWVLDDGPVVDASRKI